MFITAGYNTTFGICSDGSIVATGWNDYGQCNVSAWNSTSSLSQDSQPLSLFTYSGDLTAYRQVMFKEASASSSFTENGYVYFPTYAIDQDAERPWVEGVKGDGVGEYLQLFFERPERIDLLCIHPGFQSVYEKNNRPKMVKFDFSDGSSAEYELEDYNGDIYIKFSKPVNTEYLIITIQSVYKGDVPDTCISEVRAFKSKV